MFRRKDETDQATDDATGASATTPSGQPQAQQPLPGYTPAQQASFTAPSTATAQPQRAVEPARAATPPSYRPVETPRRPAQAADFRPASTVMTSGDKGGKRVLTVGYDILLKGEIATCDRLVIEGTVDAKLNEVNTVEIAETGSFKGVAHIENAEISGLFEGELVVRNRLVIFGTGKVRGKITYGEIEIERGGELTGDIKINKQAGMGSNQKSLDFVQGLTGQPVAA